MTDGSCPCGSDLRFADCCEPLLQYRRPATTAEALMRSRYCAYVLADIDYLEETLEPDERATHDRESTRRWAEQADWLGLEVIGCSGGGEEDDKGVVEFIASYRQNGRILRHHEVSSFVRRDGRWYFVEGELIPPATRARNHPKVGRNAPCPCGSGLKYKRCCG